MRVAGRHPFLVMFDLIAGAVLGRLEDIADAHWDELAPYSREFLDAGRRLGAADYTRAVYEQSNCEPRSTTNSKTSMYSCCPRPRSWLGRTTLRRRRWPVAHLPRTAASPTADCRSSHSRHHRPSGDLGTVRRHGEGLPLSVQLVARHFDEASLLPIAARIEPRSLRPPEPVALFFPFCCQTWRYRACRMNVECPARVCGGGA